jgi:hypothetical protein
MRAQDVINAQKDVFDWGTPKQGGMTASTFPLLKRRRQGLRLGNNFHWRLIRFTALQETFRVLITYHADIEHYTAYLGMEVGADTRLVMEYAYHGSHPGWHTHVGCGDIRKLPVGMLRGPWLLRLPGARRFSRRKLYTRGGVMTDQIALQIAATRFNLHNTGSDLFGRHP